MVNSLKHRAAVSHKRQTDWPPSRLTPKVVIATLGGLLVVPASAQTPPPDSCSGYTVCPVINFADAIANDPGIRALNNSITAIEMQTLNEILGGSFSGDPKYILRSEE